MVASERFRDDASADGAGGVRALATLGIEPALVHLNDGHAAFAVIELARAIIRLPPGVAPSP